MRWTVVPLGSEFTCGSCGRLLVSDQPIALLTTKLLKRCVECAAAQGFPLDDGEVEQERWRLERERAAARGPSPAPRASVASRHTLRRPVRASEIADRLFDSKLAATGERD